MPGSHSGGSTAYVHRCSSHLTPRGIFDARLFSDTPHAVKENLLHSLSDMGLSQRPLTDRVSIVAMALLFASGLRGLQSVKTAEIAQRACTTETTLFRHF